MSKQTIDVVIIGAGVAGACVARELSRYQLDVTVIDAALDIAAGASRANSGIVHAGFDPAPGTLKARFNVEGERLFEQWARELGFGYFRNGSLVVAYNEDECAQIEQLAQRGRDNGVEGLEIISGAHALELEPNLNGNALKALLAPSGGICDPYGLVYGAMENALSNGVKLVLDCKVTHIEKTGEGYEISTRSSSGSEDRYVTRAVINAAGVHADELNNMVSAAKISITPRRGDYCLYEQRYGQTFLRTVFQAPSERGKGVLVTPTIHGNMLIGPHAETSACKDDTATTAEGLNYILDQARKTWPSASSEGVISTFAGMRSSWDGGDFVIGEAEDAPGFFNIACFDSPGLTAAPAVAVEIAQNVATHLDAPVNEHFNPIRVPAPLVAMMDPESRGKLVESDPRYSRVICRCCDVTEGELIEAMSRSIPVMTLDSLKWRTGATMGPCQGGACEAHIVGLMAKHLGLPVHEIQKRHAGSNLAVSSNVLPDTGIVADKALSSSAEKEHDLLDAYDLIVVGGGVAGIAAARTARNEGVEDILIIDRDYELGGTVGRLDNPSFGIVRFGEMIPGFEFARREIESLNESPVHHLPGSQVVAVETPQSSDGLHLVTYVGPNGTRTIKAHAVVLACGSREISTSERALSGGRPAGVYSAGCAPAYGKLLDCTIGTNAVVYGLDSGAIMSAAGLKERGINVLGVYLEAPDASVFKPGVEGYANAIGLNMIFNKRLVQLEGLARLEAAWFTDTQTGEQLRIPCDTLVASLHSAPDTTLAVKTGAQYDPATKGLVVDEELSIGIPGIFACGNTRMIHDGADFATFDGEAAGRFAAAYLNARKGR